MDTVDEASLTEVDQEAERGIDQSHVRKQLRFVDAGDLLDRLQLDDETVVDERVEAKGLVEDVALVSNGNLDLLPVRHGLQLELSDEALLIDRLQQSWPGLPVYLDRSADDDPGPLVRPSKLGVHPLRSPVFEDGSM